MLAPYKRLFPYMGRYGGRYALGALLVIGSVSFKLSIPYLLGDAFDELRKSEEGLSQERLLFCSLGMVLAACLGALLRTGSRLCILGNSRRAIHDIRQDLFARLSQLSPSFYTRHQTGHIMSRAVNDLQNVQGLLGPVFMYLVETLALYAICIPFMLGIDPWLTLASLAPFPVFFIVARRLAGKVQVGSRQAQERLSNLSAKVDESLSGQKVIKSLALEDYDYKQFQARSQDYRNSMLTVARIRATLQPTMMFLASLSIFFALIFGAPQLLQAQLSIGQMVSMVFFLGLLAAPTATMGFVISSLQRGAAALARVSEFWDMPIEIKDAEQPVQGAISLGQVEVRKLSLSFADAAQEPHLSGSLPPTQGETRQVLQDISFSVQPGQTLAIVGAVGSGKSSLLRAIARQIVVPSGFIFIDGHDINQIPLAELRRDLGLQAQDSFLFSATLAQNIALGKPEAEPEEVMAAAQMAQLHKDLDQLPQGLSTMLGERGVNMSGGQQQRTALARVCLLAPKVLCLDDPLSAVDTHTAQDILQGLQPMLATSTLIITAHRLATIQHAQEILVLDQGRVVERGNHATLMLAKGAYAKVYQSQMRQETLAEQLGLDPLQEEEEPA